MFRRLALGLVATACLATPATAAIVLFRSPDVKVDWGAHKSLATLKCEDAKVIADIATTLRDMEWPNHKRAFSHTAKIKVYHSRTVSAAANRLVCRISINAADLPNGFLNGTFTAELQGGSKWAVYFQDID